jgi:hypothetical protein
MLKKGRKEALCNGGMKNSKKTSYSGGIGRVMKQISEKWVKPFTSSLNIYPEAC